MPKPPMSSESGEMQYFGEKPLSYRDELLAPYFDPDYDRPRTPPAEPPNFGSLHVSSNHMLTIFFNKLMNDMNGITGKEQEVLINAVALAAHAVGIASQGASIAWDEDTASLAKVKKWFGSSDNPQELKQIIQNVFKMDGNLSNPKKVLVFNDFRAQMNPMLKDPVTTPFRIPGMPQPDIAIAINHRTSIFEPDSSALSVAWWVLYYACEECIHTKNIVGHGFYSQPVYDHAFRAERAARNKGYKTASENTDNWVYFFLDFIV